MAEAMQCDNCGAVLHEEDLFCGECGAPHLSLEATVETSASEAPLPSIAPISPPPPSPVPEPPLSPPATQPSGMSQGWRTVAIIAAILAAVVAAGLCVSGLLLGFLVPDPDLGQAGTQDMIIGASICCFCPGAVALAVAVVLGAFIIRRR